MNRCFVVVSVDETRRTEPLRSRRATAACPRHSAELGQHAGVCESEIRNATPKRAAFATADLTIANPYADQLDVPRVNRVRDRRDQRRLYSNADSQTMTLLHQYQREVNQASKSAKAGKVPTSLKWTRQRHCAGQHDRSIARWADRASTNLADANTSSTASNVTTTIRGESSKVAQDPIGRNPCSHAERLREALESWSTTQMRTSSRSAGRAHEYVVHVHPGGWSRTSGLVTNFAVQRSWPRRRNRRYGRANRSRRPCKNPNQYDYAGINLTGPKGHLIDRRSRLSAYC